MTSENSVQQWLETQTRAGHPLDKLVQTMVKNGWPEATAQQAVADFTAGKSAPDGTLPARMPTLSLATHPSSLVLPDREVQVLMSCSLPQSALLGGFLSDPECDEIIALAKARLARSPTMNMETGASEINPVRSSQGMFFARGEHSVIERIESRIAALTDWPVERGEGIQVLKYVNGAEYKPHYDYFDPARSGSAGSLKRGGQRVATLVMYLSTPEQGGDTTFPDAGLAVSAIKGNAVFFSYDLPHPDTKTLHGSHPVTAGVKWAAIKWLRARTFDPSAT